jgi:hypothetical protein
VRRKALLLTLSGPTAERLGLLGGRYKRLAAKAATPAERLVYLNKSIDAYERGMEIDLNQYYCSCNLPRLYLQRNRKGDRERAVTVSQIVVAACERAKKRKEVDEWLRPTLLGAAFNASDADKAEEALSRLGTAPPLAATALTPAVPIRRSVVGQGSDDFDHSARDMISRNRYILNLPDILSVGWYEPSLDHCLAVTSYVLKIFA